MSGSHDRSSGGKSILVKSLISWCSGCIRRYIYFLGQLSSNKLSTVILSGIEMTDTVSSFPFFVLRILEQLNTFCYFRGIITQRSSEEFLAWMPNITTFLSRCMSPFKTTLSLRDSMYYYTFIAELIINISIQHADFKHWVRTYEMTERKY